MFGQGGGLKIRNILRTSYMYAITYDMFRVLPYLEAAVEGTVLIKSFVL